LKIARGNFKKKQVFDVGSTKGNPVPCRGAKRNASDNYGYHEKHASKPPA